jgi:hypothetical protein
MSKDQVISLENPDVLTGLLRSGARELIKKAVQSELAEFLSQYQDVTDSIGCKSREAYPINRQISKLDTNLKPPRRL